MLFDGKEIYNAVIADDADGITYISLVDFPAVERDFVCFAKEKEMVRFAVESEEKRIISGVIMLAETPIYRRQGDYEYYLVFNADTIRKMAQKMLTDGTFRNIDLMHDNRLVNGVKLLELYIKDDTKGINPNFVDDVPNGSLMGSFHVENEALWEEIKSGDILKGFSLEGFFTVEKMNNNNQNKTENKMSKIAKFVKSLVKFGEIATDKATLYWEGDGEIAEGMEIYVGEEEKTPAEDGTYETEDKVITIVEGKVESIKEKEVEEEKPAEEVDVEVEAEEEVPAEEVVVEPQPEERDVNAERIDALEAKVAELEKMVADLVERLTKIETAPEVAPIVEEFNKAKEVNEKGLPKSAIKSINLFKGRK